MIEDSTWIWIYRVISIYLVCTFITANIHPSKYVDEAFIRSTRNKWIWEFFKKKKHLQRPLFVVLLVMSLVLLVITFYI